MDQTETVCAKEQSENNPGMIYGLSGLVNIGNTCYMNSAIQVFSHIYPFTRYLFNEKESVIEILKKNAPNIFKNSKIFDIGTNTDIIIPVTLKKKIQDGSYDYTKLTPQEETIILNCTLTYQLIKLLEAMWQKNCVYNPSSFRKIFSIIRDKFFYSYDQHDAEEAYSCILQQIQEELAQEKNIKFKTSRESVVAFLHFKNEIHDKITSTSDINIKKKLYDEYSAKKKEMPEESLIVEAYREMKNYYSKSYSQTIEMFTGFLHSSIRCPNGECGYVSNKFDPYQHISLPIPTEWGTNECRGACTISDCFKQYTKEEELDQNNLWTCEKCTNKVRGIKSFKLWVVPQILVIQFKRFDMVKNVKNNRLIEYPLTDFDVTDVVSPVSRDKNKCYKYTLQCTINHYGSINGGHYTACCKDEDHNRWFLHDDTRTREVTPDRVVDSSAYLLVYLRQDMII